MLAEMPDIRLIIVFLPLGDFNPRVILEAWDDELIRRW
jgi:hypothetical protein